MIFKSPFHASVDGLMVAKVDVKGGSSIVFFLTGFRGSPIIFCRLCSQREACTTSYYLSGRAHLSVGVCPRG